MKSDGTLKPDDSHPDVHLEALIAQALRKALV